MPSSVIRSFSYDAARRVLRVTFVSGDAYDYAGAPPDVAAGLAAAASKGRFFAARIRDRYPFSRARIAEPDDPPRRT